MIRILLDRFGSKWVKRLGTLVSAHGGHVYETILTLYLNVLRQLADENHDMESVKMLTEGRADVSEKVARRHVDYREGENCPLPTCMNGVREV